MTPEQLREMARNQCPPFCKGESRLEQVFTDKVKGQPFNIVGNGPSAAQFKPDGKFTIACNGAIGLVPDADVWLVSEYQALQYEWFYGHEASGAIPCFADMVPAPRFDPTGELTARYSPAWWQRCVFFALRDWYEDFNIRTAPHGLLYLRNPGILNGDALGSVAMRAYHLAGLCGASEVHLYGCEFMCKDGQQHGDGWQPHSGESQEGWQPCRFDIAPKFTGREETGKQPVIKPEGQYESWPHLIHSAVALHWLIDKAGLPVTDHSGGLLTLLGAKHEVGQVERKEAKGRGKQSR